MDTTVIEQFLADWPREKDFYEAIATRAKEICETAINEGGIQCQATWRVKRTDRLETKLYARQKLREPYENKKAIREDIVDLAGVRIGLYFPRQRKTVGDIINQLFTVVYTKNFGGFEREADGAREGDKNDKDNPSRAMSQAFPGYCADHYRVYLRPEGCPKGKDWETGMIEIQVVSILRHVSAEVGHDMVYKNLAVAGHAERQILDGLSGVIYFGEFFLNQLYDRQTFNGPFETVYHLGSYLFQWMQVKSDRGSEDLGDVDLLWKLLSVMGLNGEREFRNILDKMDFSTQSCGLRPTVAPGTQKQKTIRTSIVNYIIGWIVRSEQGEGKIATQLQVRRSLGEETRYKLEVIIDSFALVSHLFSLVDWVALVMNTNDRRVWRRVIGMAKWLHGEQPWEFYKKNVPLDRIGEETIDTLWAHFEGHDQRPVQMVFRLARLGVVKTHVADRTKLVSALEKLIENVLLK